MKFFNFSLQLFITFKWFFSSTAFLSNKHDLKSWDAHYSPGLLITSFSFCLSYSPSNRGNRFEPWDFMKHGLFNIHTFIDRFAIILCMLTVTLILVMTRFQWLLESPGATHFYFFLSSNSFCCLLSTLQIPTPYHPSLGLHFMVQLLLFADSLIKRRC